MRSEKRYFDRKELDPLAIQGLISISDLTPIADGGQLVEASPSGFRIEIMREELCDPLLRENLSLEAIEGLQVSIFILGKNYHCPRISNHHGKFFYTKDTYYTVCFHSP